MENNRVKAFTREVFRMMEEKQFTLYEVACFTSCVKDTMKQASGEFCEVTPFVFYESDSVAGSESEPATECK